MLPSKAQIDYLVLGLLYGAARESQRQNRGPEWDGTWTNWDREHSVVLMELDTVLSQIERSGEIDEWIRAQTFSW